MIEYLLFVNKNLIFAKWIKKSEKIKKLEIFFSTMNKTQKKIFYFIFTLCLKLKFFNDSLNCMKKKNFFKILKSNAKNHKTHKNSLQIK